MQIKRKPTATWLAVAYLLWLTVGQPIWNLNIERVAEQNRIDGKLAEFAPMTWLREIVSYLPGSFMAGFVVGALIFAYWDVLSSHFRRHVLRRPEPVVEPASGTIAAIPDSDGQEQVQLAPLPSPPPPAIQMRTISAGANVDPAKPHYEYPKAVLQVEDLKITRMAESAGQLTSTEGRIFIKSHCYMALKKCRVAVVSLGQDGLEESLHGALVTGRHAQSGQEIGEFSILPAKTQSFPLITRDLKDLVSRPPFLLRLTNQRRPLADNTTYILTLDMHSEAQDVTRARIEIQTKTYADFSLTLLDQAVLPR